MGLISFFKLSKDEDKRFQKILCLIVWGVGGAAMCFNIFDTFLWLCTYPGFNLFSWATCVMNIALRIFVLWMPISFLLLDWRTKRISFMLYMAGGIITILLSLLSLGLTLPILLGKNIEQELANDYFSTTKPVIKGGSVPMSMMHAVKFDNCCSWYGPEDFQNEYDLEKQKDKNQKFMKDVRTCTGNIFDLKPQPNGVLKYAPGKHGSTTEVQGCSSVILERANSIAIFIIVMTFVICCVTPEMLYMHFKIYRSHGRAANSEEEAGQGAQAQGSRRQVSFAGSNLSQGEDDDVKREELKFLES